MTAAANARQSALLRLRGLPEVFDLRDVQRLLGRESATARVYCARWKRAGMVSALGPRNVGVFFNLITDPKGPLSRRAQAIEKLLRRPAVVVGLTALHAHGWTSQRPSAARPDTYLFLSYEA